MDSSAPSVFVMVHRVSSLMLQSLRSTRTFLARFKQSLTLQLELWVLVTALPSLLLGGWLFFVVYSSLTETRRQAAQTLARQTLDTLDLMVFERYGDAQVFSGLPLVRALDLTQLPVIADHLVATYAPYYRLVMAVDREGRILAVNRVDGAGHPVPSAQLLDRSVAEESWFQQALAATQPVVVEDFHPDALVEAVYRDPRPVLSLSAPIRDRSGQTVGVWSSRVALDPLVEVLTRISAEAAPDNPYPVVLRNAQGAPLLEIGVGAGVGPARTLLAKTGAPGLSRSPRLGWHVEVYSPPGAVDRRHVFAGLAVWLALVLIGGLLGLGWVTHRRLIRPVLTLIAQVQEMAKRARGLPSDRLVAALDPRAAGRFAEGVSARTDELGDLARTVRAMAGEVQGQVARLAVLNAVGHNLLQEVVSLPALLTRIVGTARLLTGARYAALAVFDETGRVTDFVTDGMDEATKQAIGDLPTGRGLLGHLAKERGALRLDDLTQHQAFSGFPPHHPTMRSFLGISLWARGRPFGRLYLADKQGSGNQASEFTETDEQFVTALADRASTSLDTATLLKEIQEAEARYRAILDSAVEGIVGMDAGGRCLFLNRAGSVLLGVAPDDLLGREMHPLLHPAPHGPARAEGAFHTAADCPMFSPLRTGHAYNHELDSFWRQDGASFPVSYVAVPLHDATSALIGVVVTFSDLTERKSLEHQLRQAQRLEALGRLAGGIAHDFNNLLTAVLGYSRLLLDRFPPGDAARREVEEIRKAGERAATLTRQILAFSRRQMVAPRVLNLNTVVTDVERMLRRLIGEDLRLATVLAPGVGMVKADLGQIEQVIVNLAVNARDAMPQGGRLIVETANVELSETYVRMHLGVQPGPYVMLAVTDTGCGMDAETRARCFEPFFTTKLEGQGTGLGLSMVYGIVKQSGGDIWVYSEPGRGTTFKIYLPRVDEHQRAHEPPELLALPAGGTEIVLLVEDDDGVRALIRDILDHQGYTVLCAANGEEAMQVGAAHQGRIHLLVTDVVMPGMSGGDVAARLMALQPGLKVLYLSGYTENTIVHQGVLDPKVAFLHKPFAPSSLSRKVREVLDA